LQVKLQWATPDIDQQILYMARVSNPDNQRSENTRLIAYLMEHGHVSPFEMANVCIEIETTRDIGRQILRHRSFSFQEFSQRYQDAGKLGTIVNRECRLQDTKNRQNSLECKDDKLRMEWESLQHRVERTAVNAYRQALDLGIAKEQARALLPEGLTMSRMYMNGNMRSWIFYLKQRLDPTTQKEHRELAMQVLQVLRGVAPITMDAFFTV
jgi:thymidylate synthase (FAD)